MAKPRSSLVWSKVVRKKASTAGATAKETAKKLSRLVKGVASKVATRVSAAAPAAKKKAEPKKAPAPAKKAPAPAAAPKAPKTNGKAEVKVALKASEKASKKAEPKVVVKAEEPAPAGKKKGKGGKPEIEKPPAIPAARPRATRLPAMENPLNKREIEQLLTAGQGRGISGEGSLKGKLVVKDGFPYLHVTGRDKRELSFLLQGPDQEVLPAYVDHKVSVSGLIKKTTNYAGTVDVRKWTAKKPEAEQPVPQPAEAKLRYLSPGEVEQLCTGGMGAGLVGFARFRGNLEMTGEDFFLMVSGSGTRQQVSFLLGGKGAKGLRKYVGQTLYVTGVVEKSSGWGGKLDLEAYEARPSEGRGMSRDNLQLTRVEGLGGGDPKAVDVLLNQGLSVRLAEKAGHIWAIEPTTAKRVGLREANFEPHSGGPATREFFFTPRNPGTFEVEFFLAKAFTPAQVARTCKLIVNVKTHA